MRASPSNVPIRSVGDRQMRLDRLRRRRFMLRRTVLVVLAAAGRGDHDLFQRAVASRGGHQVRVESLQRTQQVSHRGRRSCGCPGLRVRILDLSHRRNLVLVRCDALEQVEVLGGEDCIALVSGQQGDHCRIDGQLVVVVMLPVELDLENWRQVEFLTNRRRRLATVVSLDDRRVAVTVLAGRLKDLELDPEDVHLDGGRLGAELLRLHLQYPDINSVRIRAGYLKERLTLVRWRLHLGCGRDRQQPFRGDPECRGGGFFASGAGQGPQQQGRDGGGRADAGSTSAGELPTVHMLSFHCVQFSSMSTSVPRGTWVNWLSASLGTRMQPSLERVPKTLAVGQVWIATVPGPPPKLSRVGLCVPNGKITGEYLCAES